MKFKPFFISEPLVKLEEKVKKRLDNETKRLEVKYSFLVVLARKGLSNWVGNKKPSQRWILNTNKSKGR